MSDRIARAALCRLGEPGDPRLAALVDDLGAERVYAVLREEREASGVATEVAARLHGLDPESDLRRAGAAGIRFLVPGDEEWPDRLADLAPGGPLEGRGGGPRAVAGPRWGCGSAGPGASTRCAPGPSRWSVPGRRRLTASAWPVRWRPTSP